MVTPELVGAKIRVVLRTTLAAAASLQHSRSNHQVSSLISKRCSSQVQPSVTVLCSYKHSSSGAVEFSAFDTADSAVVGEHDQFREKGNQIVLSKTIHVCSISMQRPCQQCRPASASAMQRECFPRNVSSALRPNRC